MRNKVFSEHWHDSNLNPAGGVAFGNGFAVSWQNGPLGRGEDRREPNGAFVEDVIYAAMDRLLEYQGTKFACEANATAIKHLQYALDALDSRTKDREKREVEGTHKE